MELKTGCCCCFCMPSICASDQAVSTANGLRIGVSCDIGFADQDEPQGKGTISMMAQLEETQAM